MIAKWLLFLRSFLFLTHLAAFSTAIHKAPALNGTTGDRLALLAIKSMIKGDPQGLLTSWNQSSTDFCRWRGVTCSPRHQRVTHLNLTYGGLIGTLSPSIGNLSFLRSIRLFHNLFSGEIPPEIGRLFRLRELRLRNNSFTGSIPATIVNCSNLQVLHLATNNLVGKIPDGIGSLSRLSIISLHDNILQGGIPAEIGSLFRLQELWLYNNSFMGSIPATITNCSNLQVLDLGLNNLVGKIPDGIGSLSMLSYLSLHDNILQGGIPPEIWRLFRLQTLYLYNNSFTGNLLSIPPTLHTLSLSFNNFGGKLPSLTNGSALIFLDLSDNYFVGSLHNLVCSNGMSKTRYVDLGYNQLSGVIPECWDKWPSLASLYLNDNNLSGEIPRTLGSIPLLQLLDMRGNMISRSLPSSLMNLSYLKILRLGRNNLAGIIPPWIGIKLTMLKILNLRSNNFYGNTPNQLCYLSHVQVLDLAHNNLSGNIPRCFNNFSVLSGKESNLELNFLSSFNVSYNNLTGRIPTGTQIQSFNESSFIGNKLCGAPLTNDCGHVDKPDTTSDQKEDGGSHKVDWGLIISIALGFIIGFWGIVVSLMLNRSWRITYFRLLRKLIKV
ncbi:putative non-specific serine/threonine protein kinase [Helianthus annuus]|nr:putative non-specific serine/threonine protein kinase [Helianthus annuus]